VSASSDIDVLKLEVLPILKRSVTTGAGNAGGTTLVDSTLVEADNFWVECWVLLRTGGFALQLRQVVAFDQATNTITLDHGVGGQIVAGVEYVMGVRIPTVDSGVHSNPAKWLHDNHWDCDEQDIAANGVGGQQLLGVVVPVGKSRRIREVTIRHEGTNSTVVTMLIGKGATRLTVKVPASMSVLWSSEDGRVFTAGQQPAVQSSDVTGGHTYVSAAGVEA